LFFLRFISRDESHHALNWILVHVLEVGPVRHI
jgi:hypothetical protein